MHRLFALFSLLAVSFLHSKEVPFQATSVGTSFAIAGELNGTFDADRNKVTVTVNNGYLIRQACPYQGKREVKQITAYLAGWAKAHRNFEAFVYSAPFKIEKSIELGETISLGRVKFEIPVKGLAKEDLEKAWLVFSIVNETQDKDGKPRAGTCDVHASTSLAGTFTGFPCKREKTASGDLKVLEQSLAPAVSGLTPAPTLSFLPVENMMHVDFRTKHHKVAEHSQIGGAIVAPRYEHGPDEQGFMLTAQLQDVGAPNSLSALATPKGLHWKTEMGVTRIPETSRQISWSLSYGAKTEPELLQQLRQGLQHLPASN